MGNVNNIILGIQLANMILGLIRQARQSDGQLDLDMLVPALLAGVGQIGGVKELQGENLNVLLPMLRDLLGSIKMLREPSAGQI
jgi:hypothetical protein